MVSGFSFRRGGSSTSDESLTAEQVWSRLLAWQTRREHTQYELREKLAQLGVAETVAEQGLAKLQEYGLQDDDRCAEGIVRGQLQRGRGRRAIAQRLQQKGLSADHAALAEHTDRINWVDAASELLQRRFGLHNAESVGDPAELAKAQAKQIRFLQYRGFSLHQAIEAVKARRYQ